MNNSKIDEIITEYNKCNQEYVRLMKVVIKETNIYERLKSIIDNIVSYAKKIVDYIKTVSKKDLIKIIEPFTNVLKRDIELCNYLLTNESFVEEELNIIVKNIVRNMKKTNKAKHKIEKTYDENDDDFWWYAAWFL